MSLRPHQICTVVTFMLCLSIGSASSLVWAQGGDSHTKVPASAYYERARILARQAQMSAAEATRQANEAKRLRDRECNRSWVSHIMCGVGLK
jgi:hypothetical protein